MINSTTKEITVEDTDDTVTAMAEHLPVNLLVVVDLSFILRYACYAAFRTFLMDPCYIAIMFYYFVFYYFVFYPNLETAVSLNMAEAG
jgi:hypothetical protein